MIGVVARPSDYAIVREFFELFKTPWEPFQTGRLYDVLLVTEDRGLPPHCAKLVIIYSSGELASDKDVATRHWNRCLLRHESGNIPVYGDCVTFPVENSGTILCEASSNEAVNQWRATGDHLIVRIGYDLFDEIRHLLTVGQPQQYAGIPTLELHIAVLRQLIITAGRPLIEIPPVPMGYSCITCLTHDIDHPSIRKHKWDHTLLGFLFRAVILSAKEFLLGSMLFRDLRANWAAAFKLPFVYFGLARDFWEEFPSRYRQVEKGLPSTYFVIPYRGRAGRDVRGMAPSFRASAYQASNIAGLLRDLMAEGHEIALHGIDAWVDAASGRQELDEIRQVTDGLVLGTRMHWLYFDTDSPAKLEEAGASYDSTVGYRDTVGYRAGTTQAYRPPGANTLLELPMHIMDTALFYASYLGLDQEEATRLLRSFASQVERLGGCLTINWHDRSLAPERLWYGPYCRLLDDLKERNTWFATSAEAAAWFRKRRAFSFRVLHNGQDPAISPASDGLPGLTLRFYNHDVSRGTRPPVPAEIPLASKAVANLP